MDKSWSGIRLINSGTIMSKQVDLLGITVKLKSKNESLNKLTNFFKQSLNCIHYF